MRRLGQWFPDDRLKLLTNAATVIDQLLILEWPKGRKQCPTTVHEQKQNDVIHPLQIVVAPISTKASVIP